MKWRYVVSLLDAWRSIVAVWAGVELGIGQYLEAVPLVVVVAFVSFFHDFLKPYWDETNREKD